MKFLFIDSDILLDAILNRSPYYMSAAKVLALAGGTEFSCCTTVHSLLNVHQVIQRAYDKPTANNAVKLLIERLQIIMEGKEVVDQALASNFTDFEDAVQYFAASNASCDMIITRNTKDYKNSNIPVLTAEQFLREILK